MTVITRSFPCTDLEALEVRAVANGWLVTIGIEGHHRGHQHGEQFVFASAADLAKWMVAMLPEHRTHLPV